MKRIIAKRTLRKYWEKHADCEQYLKIWFETARTSDWNSPSEIKKTYANASILKNGRVVFNIRPPSPLLIINKLHNSIREMILLLKTIRTI